MVFLERLAFVKSFAKPGCRTLFSEIDAQSAADVVVVVIGAMLLGSAQFQAAP
jgi:hypothetical protein